MLLWIIVHFAMPYWECTSTDSILWFVNLIQNDVVEKNRQHINDVDKKSVNDDDEFGVPSSIPIPLPAHDRSPEGEFYYM